MAKKFDWRGLSEKQRDSVLNKVVKPYLDENWGKMGIVKRTMATKALQEAGKFVKSKKAKKSAKKK